MKKIIAVVLATTALFFYGVTNSMAEWTAGVSITYGEYSADGQENENGHITHANNVSTGVTYPTIFIEKDLDYGFSIGLDVIPGAVESEEASRTDFNNLNAGYDAGCGNDGGCTSTTNKASVSLSQHLTLYALVPIMDTGAYARLGVLHVNVETKENLTTGSKYEDDRIAGATIGIGYQHDTGAGFIRAEVGHSRYEKVALTSTTNSANKVEATLSGNFGRISIGRTF